MHSKKKQYLVKNNNKYSLIKVVFIYDFSILIYIILNKLNYMLKNLGSSLQMVNYVYLYHT